jgi:hypothetical protein
MEDNPYQAPRESGEPIVAEPEDWSRKFRRWSIGPLLPLEWLVALVGVGLLMAILAAVRLSR